MGSSNSKIECLIKPGQSGKTRTMQERIKDYEKMAEMLGDECALNIVICSNNKKLVEQTTARMNDDLFDSVSTVSNESNEKSDDKIVGTCFSWASGTKKTNVSTDALAWKITKGDVSMVVCCAHKKRLAYLFSLLNELNASPLFSRQVNIFIDEADESIKLWSPYESQINAMAKVNKVMLVSATFNSIANKYQRIRIVPLVETYNPETYSKVSDCNILGDETVGSACDYIKGVFAKHEDTLTKPGLRLFAPGNIQKITHTEIADFLRTKGYAVMILNGTEKCIIKPDGSKINIADHIDENKPEEIGKVMTRIYYDNGLDKGLFAITGQLCLGRGLTFQNENFMFGFGIIPPMSDAANAYQCACRMAGNIKKVNGYRQATLVTTMKMKQTILKQEDVAATLARRVYDGEISSEVGEEEFGIAAPKKEEDPNMSIPVVFSIASGDVEFLREATTAQKRTRIQKLLTDNGHAELSNKLKQTFKCKQVTCPMADKQYAKVVTDVVSAAAAGRRPGVFKEEERKENVWQAVIDAKENRLVITYYEGAKA